MNSDTAKVKLYQELHKNNATYGSTGSVHTPELILFIEYLKPKVVLDYGCGKGALINELSKIFPEIEFYGYDPAIPGRTQIPVKTADLVISTDVFEHIPETELEEVIENISKISQNCYFNLHHAAAITLLANGENAHCTIKPSCWYVNLINKYFPTIICLDGRHQVSSAIITFAITFIEIDAYNSIVKPLKKIDTANTSVVPPVEITVEDNIKEGNDRIPPIVVRLLACCILNKEKRKQFRTKLLNVRF